MLQRTTETLRYLAGDPVGKAVVGSTPHTVIHRDGKASVRYFAPVGEAKAPLFISMPLINRWYVWDLRPDVSLVGKLIAAGHPVYLLDWGVPGDEDADRPLTYYVDDVLGRAFSRTRRHAAKQHGTDRLAAIGYCVGGTFLAIHLARHPEQAAKVAFVCTPIDFHQSGRLALWARPGNFPLHHLIDSVGNYPGELMRTSFQWLKPTGQARKWFSIWERGHDPAFRDLWSAMERWSNDAVDFPGEAYREYIQGCYFDNALVNGGWKLGGELVDGKRATIPALSIAATDDHIVEPDSAHALAQVWGGPVTTKTIKGGHVGVSVGSALPNALLEWAKA